jgi:UDP-3-O-[3-hydroxymyristoyl] glucosamine N-acyltransferase
MPQVSLGEIVDKVGGRFDGPRDRVIRAVAPLGEATPDALSFLENPKYESLVRTTRAGAILVSSDLAGDDARWIRVDNPRLAFATVVAEWFSRRPMPIGISPQALVAPSARLGRNVAIGPFVRIGEEVEIGDNVSIFQGVSIEAGSAIGDETVIYPNVVIYDRTRIGKRCIIHGGVVIGGDGYGFTARAGRHHKLPQVGSVRIEDDVEIGSNTTIDRAALGETVIGEGTKIDNLVQIGHGVKIGKHCLLVAQVGIAGSTEVGNWVAIAGQSGLSEHLKIGDRAQIAAKSAVLADVPEGAKVMGSPAMPFRSFVRREAMLRRLVQKKGQPC